MHLCTIFLPATIYQGLSMIESALSAVRGHVIALATEERVTLAQYRAT